MATQEDGIGRPRRFEVIPAVDLLGDEAVRLEQGDYERVGVRAGDPEELVSRFAGHQPPWIHLVDLEGARTGVIRPALVRRLVLAADAVPVQVSGGIRSVADAEELLGAGAARIVVGTAAFLTPGGLAGLVDALGEHLVVALDVRAERIALAGWRELSDLTPEEGAARCASAGVSRVLCTATERDGTLGGPDLDLLRRVEQASGLPILAAGGVRSESDLAQLARLGLEGAIVGRALLEGAIPLSAVEASPARP